MQVQNQAGEVLWSPSDFGNYDIEKIEAIGKILAKLLETLTVKTTQVIQDSSGNVQDTSGYYTRDQADNKFLTSDAVTQLVTDLATNLIEQYVQDNGAVTQTEFNRLEDWIVNQNNETTGVNLRNPTEPSGVCIALRLDSLETRESADASNINKLLSVVYKSNPSDGSLTSVVQVAFNDDIGISKTGNVITSLSSSISDRSSIVAAINSLVSMIPSSSDISSLKTKVGIDTLQTSSKNLSGAVNEIKGQVKSLSDQIGNLASADSLYADKTSVLTVLNQIAQEIQTINSRLDALEATP